MNGVWQDLRQALRGMLKQPGFTLIAATTLALGIGAGQEPSANVRNVTSDYFQTIKIPLLQGRYFSEQDQRGGVGAAIVNETFAKRLLANENPIGQRIKDLGVNQNEGDPKQYEIVGVVGDVHHNSLTRAATPELYLPHRQNSWAWGNFLVRTTNDPATLTHSFEDAIRSIDKTVTG